MSFSPVVISDFKGLSFFDDRPDLDASWLGMATNVDIEKGIIKKRSGWDLLSALPVAGTPHILGSYGSALVVAIINGTNVKVYTYTMVTAVWALVVDYTTGFTGTEFFFGGVSYATDFYFYRYVGGVEKISKWNGTVLTDSATTLGTTPFMVAHKDRIFTFNPFGHRLFFSEIAVTSWPGTNFIDINVGDNDTINAIISYRDSVYIFKSKSIWVLDTTGAPEDWSLRNISMSYGTIGGRSVVEADDYLYFRDFSGIIRTDGLTFEDVSQGGLTHNHPYTLAVGEQKYIYHLISVNRKIFFINWDIAASRQYFTLDIDSLAWTLVDFEGGVDPTEVISVEPDANTGGILGVGTLGVVRLRPKNDVNFLDYNSPYSCVIKTLKSDFGYAHLLKRLRNIILNIRLNTDVTVFFGNETVLNASGVFGVDDFVAKPCGGYGYFRSNEIGITTPAHNSGFELSSITLDLRVKRSITART